MQILYTLCRGKARRVKMRISIQTLGCKVNQYETQAMESILTDRGHVIVPADSECDVCIINTCAVTAESGRKSRQAVRHEQKRHPGAIIAVGGCYSQISPEEAAALGADIVFGSGERKRFLDELERVIRDREQIVSVDDAMRRRVFEELPAGSVSGRTRALMKIQDGCVNFCTYCIIPYSRGPVRSLPLDKVSKEARRIAQQGYREIVITGIEIASYGRDFKDGTTLKDAVCAIADAAPGVRLRLGSLEPRIITEELCRELAQLDGLCPQFHLSLQSGCDETLARMKRKYDSARFYESVELLRRYFPSCALTADLIVGFPGETEEEFAKSMDFIRRCGFSHTHVFPYSRRPGTPAADMPGQLTNAEKQDRAARAGAIAAEMEKEFLSSCVGTVQKVLFEQENGGISSGHAENYCLVRAEGTGLKNCVMSAEITGYEKDGLIGRIIQ